jgi:hypothetical protein
LLAALALAGLPLSDAFAACTTPKDPFPNSFNKNSAPHRPVGTGAQYAAANHPSTISRRQGRAIGINVGAPWGVSVASTDAADPLRTIGAGKANCDKIVGLPKTIRMPKEGFITKVRMNPNGCTDGVVVIYDRVQKVPHQIRQYNWTGGKPLGGQYKTWSSNGLGHGTRPGDRLGTSASGVAALFGVLRGEEINNPSKKVEHALQMALPRKPSQCAMMLSRKFVLPAVGGDGSMNSPGNNLGNIPYGVLMALPPPAKGGPNLDALGLTARGKRLAEAVRDYGIYVVDGGACNAIRADQHVGNASDLKAALSKTSAHAHDPQQRRAAQSDGGWWSPTRAQLRERRLGGSHRDALQLPDLLDIRIELQRAKAVVEPVLVLFVRSVQPGQETTHRPASELDLAGHQNALLVDAHLVYLREHRLDRIRHPMLLGAFAARQPVPELRLLGVQRQAEQRRCQDAGRKHPRIDREPVDDQQLVSEHANGLVDVQHGWARGWPSVFVSVEGDPQRRRDLATAQPLARDGHVVLSVGTPYLVERLLRCRRSVERAVEAKQLGFVTDAVDGHAHCSRRRYPALQPKEGAGVPVHLVQPTVQLGRHHLPQHGGDGAIGNRGGPPVPRLRMPLRVPLARVGRYRRPLLEGHLDRRGRFPIIAPARHPFVGRPPISLDKILLSSGFSAMLESHRKPDSGLATWTFTRGRENPVWIPHITLHSTRRLAGWSDQPG